MELRQLKYFVRAAERSNFTQAAAELYITQSTLSHQIKELEHSLDTLLFDRIGKRVRLTEAGLAMLAYAKRIIRQAEEGQQALLDLNNLKTGNLTIGVTYGLSQLLIQSITEFNKDFPDIRVRIVFGPTSELRKKLNTFEIDCMLSFMPLSKQEKQLVTTELFSAHLSLIVHRSHQWAKLKKVTLKNLTELPLALPSASYSIRNFLDEQLAGKRISLDPKIEINDIHSLLELTRSNRWNTVLMSSSLFGFEDLKAIPIEDNRMLRKATIAVSSEIYPKKALIAFQEIIRQKSSSYLKTQRSGKKMPGTAKPRQN